MKKEKVKEEKEKEKEMRFYRAYSDEELNYFLKGVKEGIKPEILWKNYCEMYGRNQYSSGHYIGRLCNKLEKKYPRKWNKKNLVPYIYYINQQDRIKKRGAYIAREKRAVRKQLKRLGIKKVKELNKKRARARRKKDRPRYNKYQREYTKENPKKRKKAVNKYRKEHPERNKKMRENIYKKDKALFLKRKRNCAIINFETKKIYRDKLKKEKRRRYNRRLKKYRREFKLYWKGLEKRIEHKTKPIIYSNILKLLDLGFKAREKAWTGYYLAKKIGTSRANMNIYKKYPERRRRQMSQEALEILLKEIPVPIRKIPLIINNISNYKRKEKKIQRKKTKEICKNLNMFLFSK